VFSRTLIKRYRLCAAGALTGGALAVFAAAAGYAQTDEIQVYDAEINQPGQFSLQLHNNYTPVGREQPDFTGGIAPSHTLNGVPEWALGITEWLELGAYAPLYSRTGTGRLLIDGAKLHEGEVLDMLVQHRRDTRAALRLMRNLLKKQGFAPKLPVTDKLRSYAAAFRRLRLTCPHEQGLRKTTAPKTRIRQCDGESAKCNSSSRLAPPSGFSACTPPSTTSSISNAILCRARRSGSSGPRRRTNGEMRLPQRDRVFRPGMRLLHRR
jgi:hypothetical protein